MNRVRRVDPRARRKLYGRRMTHDDRPDTTEMNAIHGVFRQTFAMTPQLVGGVADGDRERAELVGSVVADVVEVLDLHHQGEDELMMPRLRDRSGQPELVDRVAGQHTLIHEPLAETKTAVARWRTSAAAEDGRAVVAAIERLAVAALPHLDEEEAALMPLAAEHLTVEEWGELPGHTMSRFQGDLFFIMGMVRDNMTDEQRARMLEELPPPAAEAWRSVGIEAYKTKVAALMSP
jgi:hypothetical protein